MAFDNRPPEELELRLEGRAVPRPDPGLMDVTLTWNSVDDLPNPHHVGEVEYKVYRRISGGTQWDSLGLTDSTAFTDLDVAPLDILSALYEYTVRPIDGLENERPRKEGDSSGSSNTQSPSAS